MTSDRLLQWIVLLCVIAIFLTGLGFIDHLSWKECLRLLIIQIGLAVLYIKNRERLQEAPLGQKMAYETSPFFYVAALVVVFVVTQFDPATSAIAFLVPQARSNPFFIITTAITGFVAIVFLILRWRDLRLQNLTVPDWIAIGVTLAVITLSLGSKEVVGVGISGPDLLASLKIFSYLFIWFPVTRIYSEPNRRVIRLPDSWVKRILLNKWQITMVVMGLLFVPTLIYGVYRTGLVLYHYERSQKLFQTEDWETATTHYEIMNHLNKSVGLSAIRDRYLSDLATLHLRLNDRKKAQGFITRLRHETYDQRQADRKVGDVYFRAEKWSEAATVYETFLQNAGKDDVVLDQLGEAYLQLQDSRRFSTLVEKYRYVPHIDAQTYANQIFLGNVHLYRGDIAAAHGHFETAAELKPVDAYALYKLGQIYLSKRQIEQALRQFQKALAIDSDFPDVYYQIGFCYEKLERRDEAWNMYVKTVELLPNHIDALQGLERLSTR